MSEGQVFLSVTPNLTLRMFGKAFEFKNCRYPAKPGAVCTDEAIIAMMKSHPEYGKTFETEEDKEIKAKAEAEKQQLSPKAEAALVESAMKALDGIPGLKPSDLTVSQPPSEQPLKSPEQESEQSAQVPSLTEVSHMKKKALIAVSKEFSIEGLLETDTVAILRRRVKSWIKQKT